jgi:glycosyltransferase involved in cell wall biosynthesis
MGQNGKPRIAVLYHYFHPDDVVSARHLTQFCLELKDRGWQVEVLPCSRGCRDESASYPLREDWEGLAIRRVWRPRFRQASGAGRILNAVWMLAAWSRLALRGGANVPDVVLVGTDPILSVLVAPVLRRLRPRMRVAHWCFDLYPEAAIADGVVAPGGWLARVLHALLRAAYGSCDLVADLGSCMRERLESYGHTGRKVTLAPWALVEPEEPARPDPSARRALFGDGRLGLLYSGNFGRAHSFHDFLQLARRLRGDGVRFCFGVRGNRAEELRAAIRPDDTNVSLAGFAPEPELPARLGAADIHLVSLRPEWSGLVVPSKFFGALAAGRPVLFAGPRDAAIARWIAAHGVGWVLDPRSQEEVAGRLRSLALAPEALADLKRHCHRVYHEHFSRCRVMDQWHRELLSASGKGDPAARAAPRGPCECPPAGRAPVAFPG